MQDVLSEESNMNLATTNLVRAIRAEFGKLCQLPVFRRLNAEAGDCKEFDLSPVRKNLSDHAPIFTEFMTALAANTVSGGNKSTVQSKMILR